MKRMKTSNILYENDHNHVGHKLKIDPCHYQRNNMYRIHLPHDVNWCSQMENVIAATVIPGKATKQYSVWTEALNCPDIGYIKSNSFHTN